MSNKKKQNHKPAERRHEGEREPARNAGNRDAALRYAQLGFPIVPLHGTKKDGSCTCGRSGCAQPGRHPRTVNGLRDATTDPELVRGWWAESPKAKIAIVLGSKLLAVTTDDAAADQRLFKIIEANQKLPRTITILDHERRTRLFKGDGSQLRKADLADGVHILGEGDFIVAPSRLQSTRKRRFEEGLSPEQVEIAQVPNWLLEISAKQAKRSISATGGTAQVRSTLVVVRSSEIEPEPIQWIWPSVIASGRVTALVGHPGLGKSQVATYIAATISTGRDWPGGVANGNAGNVLILTEDDAAATVVPRLMAAGADLARIHLVTAVRDGNGQHAFDLALDLDQLEREYDLGQFKLVIIDPVVSASLLNNARNIRTVLARLTTFAKQHQLGVLTIQHLNKSGATRDIIRITGSPEWGVGPRAVFLVTEEAGTARRLFLPLKNNLSPDRTGYAFDIVNKIIDNSISTSAVEWSKDPVTISADDALAAAAETFTSGGAKDFLRDILRDGPRDATEIHRLGREAGYSEKMLRSAGEKLGANSRKKPGANGKWEWVLSGGAPELKSLADDGLAEDDDTRVEAEEENGGFLQCGNKPDDPA